MDNDDVQELPDSHNEELTTDELIEMHEQDIEQLESLEPVRSENRMTIGNLTESLNLNENGRKKRKHIKRILEQCHPHPAGHPVAPTGGEQVADACSLGLALSVSLSISKSGCVPFYFTTFRLKILERTLCLVHLIASDWSRDQRRVTA
ncbi:hypothetical protein TNCV_4070851 [Trichonephila clavipes]|nr:hypothetical protein TNCV_4070851 [Trichonephila clavipes]